MRDYGPGVPDDAKDAVFERFHRGSDATRGSGLGLNIVQVIARAHGGSARVVDAYDGPGAVFILTLPLGGAAVPADVTADAAPAPLVIPPQPPLPPPPTDAVKETPWPRS